MWTRATLSISGRLMNFMAVSSSSLGLVRHINHKRGGTSLQSTVIRDMKLALFARCLHADSLPCIVLNDMLWHWERYRPEKGVDHGNQCGVIQAGFLRVDPDH